MSINSTRIVCTGCDYETHEVYRPIRIRYQSKSGSTIETGRTKGWCYDCAGYSDIERISPDELHEELVSKEHERLEAHRRQGELNRGFLSSFRHRSEKRQLQYQLECLNEEIAELCGLLEIAKNRKSKARCLRCWSDRTAPLRFDSEKSIASDFQHECGGSLKIVQAHSGPRFNFRVSTFVLDEEGELIGEE